MLSSREGKEVKIFTTVPGILRLWMLLHTAALRGAQAYLSLSSGVNELGCDDLGPS